MAPYSLSRTTRVSEAPRSQIDLNRHYLHPAKISNVAAKLKALAHTTASGLKIENLVH